MAEKGWIKLHRRILECDFWIDAEESYDRRSAWIDLLLLANHRDKKIVFNGNVIEVKRGQYLTSVRKLAERWGWGKDKTLKFLRVLEEFQMVDRESDNFRTLLTIVNYEVYQGDADTEQTQVDTRSRHEQATNKNIKNDKKLKNIYGNFQNVKLTQEEYDRLSSEFTEEKTIAAIEYLSEYIVRKGYKAKDHNLTIRKWVFDAVDRESKQKPINQFNSYQRTDYGDVDALEKELMAN